MSWGGKRTGAGSKPRPKQTISPFKVMLGGVADSASDADLLEPPSDLPPDQQAFWRIAAPLALDQRTLTKQHVPSFRLLCELYVKKAAVGAMVDQGALGGLRVYMQLCKQVEGLFGRFMLAPFGKPAKSDKPKAATNPWSQAVGK